MERDGSSLCSCACAHAPTPPTPTCSSSYFYDMHRDMEMFNTVLIAFLIELIHGIIGRYVYNFQPFLTRAEVCFHAVYIFIILLIDFAMVTGFQNWCYTLLQNR